MFDEVFLADNSLVEKKMEEAEAEVRREVEEDGWLEGLLLGEEVGRMAVTARLPGAERSRGMLRRRMAALATHGVNVEEKESAARMASARTAYTALAAEQRVQRRK